MQEQDGDVEPAHHARRPMNAFLIFCKRHRSVVRDKYPNLENRSITKILGEWWANLDKEEKACYTGLAKQYKDAFFNANPDFKWYKLPAPPLRTLSSRPREVTDRPRDVTDRAHEAATRTHDVELEKTNNNSTKLDFNKKTVDQDMQIEKKSLSMFTPGKLADEAQMGGLSSLLATKTETQTPNPYYSPPSYKYAAISPPDDFRSQSILEKAKSKGLNREESIRELQNALSETTRMFEENFDAEEQMYDRNDQFTNQDVIDQIVDKRYSKDDDPRNWSDDDKKSGRSCKGKRYQEFMAVGGLIVNKRQKRDYNDRMPDDYLASCSWEPGSLTSEDSTVADDSKLNITLYETSAEIDGNNEADALDNDNNPNKAFKPADFDLDAKIRALPSLSLEKFQQKKRENKRKKKTMSLKPKAADPSQIVNAVPYYEEGRSLAESWRDSVIGSQKRKPRKVSITRLEINSLVSSEDASKTHKISPEIKIATEAPRALAHNMEFCKQPQHGSVDLMALATLAEVASNTSKIENTTILDTITAKGNDGNASTVYNTT